jgi:voltage-gated potassium channel
VTSGRRNAVAGAGVGKHCTVTATRQSAFANLDVRRGGPRDHERRPGMLNRGSRELKNPGYELFIGLVSVLSVFNALFIIAADSVKPGGGPARDVLVMVDDYLTLLFVVDFMYRLITARSRRDYMLGGFGWADFIAIDPMFRVFRIFGVARLMWAVHIFGIRRFVRALLSARAESAFLLTLFLVLLVTETAAASIDYVEAGAPNASIKTGGDGLWWALATITTVGYGDVVPVTTVGREIGAVLMFTGIGLFCVLTGFLVRMLLGSTGRANPGPQSALQSILQSASTGDRDAGIAALRALLAEQEARAAETRSQLELYEGSRKGGMV